MQNLYLYNSLTNKKELFEPVKEGYVGMYVCGPTVYSNVHLGNVRTFMSFDMIFRYLMHLGYKVRYVRNITDVGHLESDADEGEDKIGKKATNSRNFSQCDSLLIGSTSGAHTFPYIDVDNSSAITV